MPCVRQVRGVRLHLIGGPGSPQACRAPPPSRASVLTSLHLCSQLENRGSQSTALQPTAGICRPSRPAPAAPPTCETPAVPAAHHHAPLSPGGHREAPSRAQSRQRRGPSPWAPAPKKRLHRVSWGGAGWECWGRGAQRQPGSPRLCRRHSASVWGVWAGKATRPSRLLPQCALKPNPNTENYKGVEGHETVLPAPHLAPLTSPDSQQVTGTPAPCY